MQAIESNQDGKSSIKMPEEIILADHSDQIVKWNKDDQASVCVQKVFLAIGCC